MTGAYSKAIGELAETFNADNPEMNSKSSEQQVLRRAVLPEDKCSAAVSQTVLRLCLTSLRLLNDSRGAMR